MAMVLVVQGNDCNGLDLCSVKIYGPFFSQGDAEGGSTSDITSIPCTLYDYSDLEDAALYPVVYSLYHDQIDEVSDPDVANTSDGFPDDGVWLGATIDAENTDNANGDANGDDSDGIDDEDGVTVLSTGAAGGTAVLRVVGNSVDAGATVQVGLWIDWDGDGMENTADEFYTGSGVTASPVNIDITINIPAGQTSADVAKAIVKARKGGGAFTFGELSDVVLDGEVEGHLFGGKPAILLPIELVSFEASMKRDHNIITWITASETNADFYEVQRSIDGKNFEAITQIKAEGTTSNTSTYNYKDYTFDAKSYYRLREVDFDGIETISEIVVVERDFDAETVNIQVYPNPTTGLLNFKYQVEGNQIFQVTIYDNLGREIIEKSIKIKDYHLDEIDISDLPQGAYQVAIRSARGNNYNFNVIKN